MSIILKRIYEENNDTSGYRVLVDRIWPRGISKEDANLDAWEKEIAPSTSLRKWFDHDREKFQEFKESYKEEIEGNSENMTKLRELRDKSKSEDLILLFGAKDMECNHAVVLKEMMEEL